MTRLPDSPEQPRFTFAERKAWAEQIRAMFPLITVAEGWAHPKHPLIEWRKWRGKAQWVAGYSHTRIHAHHFSGRVYDRVLGSGPTAEAAIEAMYSALTRVTTKEE